MSEEHLRVRFVMVRVDNDESWLLFVQNTSERDVHLSETGQAIVDTQHLLYTSTCGFFCEELDVLRLRMKYARSRRIFRSRIGLQVRPPFALQTSLKYSVTSSNSDFVRSANIIQTSSQPISCIPRRSISSGIFIIC